VSNAKDVRTDEGLRQALRDVGHVGSWDVPAGQGLLGEIRRRAVRNAAHVALAVEMPTDRGLVDDVVTAAWIVLRRHSDAVRAATAMGVSDEICTEAGLRRGTGTATAHELGR
jgi:hypothetical protein